MAKIPVFGGLGSDIIFSNATRDQATQDARSLQGQILAETCHKTFLEEISLASSQADGATIIDLNDFRRPQDIIQPCQRYHHHPVVQHATLSLVQLLRYQSHGLASPRSNNQETVAVSGFCAGLFAAVAAATIQSPLQYFARVEECFRAAVMLGIVFVGNIEEKDMLQLISAYSAPKSLCTPIYVSSLNTRNIVTVSGEGDALREFARNELPTKCRVIPTNIFTLYHNRCLHEYKYQLLDDFEKRQIAFPSQQDLVVPIISTIDGSMIRAKKGGSSTDLLSQILDMILMECTNWISVEDAIVSLARERRSQNHDVLTVCNYGPSNGALTRPKDVPEHVEVIDTSVELCTGPTSQEGDIAIVGMSVDLPGAPDPEALWRNLMNGINSCSEIPSDRFQLDDYFHDGSHPVKEKRSMGTQFGNFMDDPFQFDNQAFGISPREASSMDPQQRVMLTIVHRALENAGYVPDSTPSFARETFGCFIGNATLDYVDNLRNNIDVYYSPGTLRAFLSGRISYAFKWSGPSITLDTACSSSLVAIHQAARALAAGECRAAVAGGVNVITSPDMYLGLERAHFLSPTGQCKAFDKAADGYCRSEGCAAVVLKRLSDAVNENDNILGVIKGIAVNQSGQASSITHPHAPTQEKLFHEVLSKAGMRHEDVSVVEAHGTGTPAGDPNEVRGIRNVFCKGRSLDNPLHVMSMKANIGHCEAASGVASLTKLLLMLKHKRIPPQALLNELNPAIRDLVADGTVISTEPLDWTTSRGKRRTALLNNFGAAGSNAALLIQEHGDTRKQRPALGDAITHVFGCSARSAELLQQLRKSLVSYLMEHQSELAIADVCYTSTARRSSQSYRLSTTASSIKDLIANLKNAQILEAPDSPRATVFLFSGQGSQYMGMGKKLMDLSPKFTAGKLKRTERALARRKASLELGGHQMFSTSTMYKKIFSRVVEYGPQYWAVRKLYVDDDAEEIFATCELPATSSEANYAGHPILLDTMLHVAGFAANLNVDADTVCICHQVSSISMFRKGFRPRHAFDVHCSNSSVTAAAESIFADVHAVDGEGVIAIMKGVEFKCSKLSKIQAGFEIIADFPKTSDKAHQHIKQKELRAFEEQRPAGTKLEISVEEYDESTAVESLVTSPARVVDILSETTGVKAEALTSRTKLAALGVDSLMILELEKKLEDLLGHSPGVSQLSMCECVGDVESLVNVASAEGSRSPGTGRCSPNAADTTISSSKNRTANRNEVEQSVQEPEVSNEMMELLRNCLRLEKQPMRIQNGLEFLESAPMYLVHPGAGMCFEYYRIGPLNRAVHAIQDPRMFSGLEEDWSCIQDMTEHYATIVSKSRPSSPSRGIILGGYSFGGVVAFEMARLLSERGDCLVRGVVLIDSPPPLDHLPLARETIQAAMAAKHVHTAKTRPPEAARFHEAVSALAVRNNLRRAALLGQYRPRREGVMPRVVLLRSTEGFKAPGHALPDNKWLHDRTDVKTSSGAWEELVGAKVKVIDIPGDHFTPFEPGHIDGTSQAIYEACEMLED
ncbi:hypothetical protein N8I77_004910 [Diaporthe amygdali]|uniref:Uncharacterized protein n=1 Tax=Phomopsis amygdali TaxID=1214568 RepID=A0AAD9SPD5_PHOAM|nr:hypothetical protein N8I77_004910 [Diaporthe amygdali]